MCQEHPRLSHHHFRGPDWKGGNADGLLGGSGEGTVTKVFSMSDHDEDEERACFFLKV